MKRFLFLTVAAVLLSPGPVSAFLTVYEYVPGEKVTWDEDTGKYWYWNLADFTNMTYDEQIAAIAGLGTYGNIAGGWHMADMIEMRSLYHYATNTDQQIRDIITTKFAPSSDKYWYGRYDSEAESGHHYYTGVYYGGYDDQMGPILLESARIMDISSSNIHSAWVVTDHPIVPVPGAFILAATGLLSMLGLNRLRRKR